MVVLGDIAPHDETANAIGRFVGIPGETTLDAATASEDLPGNGLLDAAVMKMRLWWRLVFGN